MVSKKISPMRKKTRKKLSAQEKAQIKEQKAQQTEITNILKNIGFSKLPYIDGRKFQYDGRTTEMDDIFIYENVILIVEYTIGAPGDHLLKKNYFYKKVNENKRAFVDFLLAESKLSSFKTYYDDKISHKYTKNQLHVKILYCSKQTISAEHKGLVDKDVLFF